MRFITGADYGPFGRRAREDEETIDLIINRYGVNYVFQHPEVLFRKTRDPIARFIEAYRILQDIYRPVPVEKKYPHPMAILREGMENSYKSFPDYHGHL